MNDNDWMKKRRFQPGGGCTLLPFLIALLAIAAASACDAPEKAGGDTAADTAAADTDPCAPSEDTADASPLALEGDVGCGADIFAEQCSGCHGAAGEGTDAGAALDEHVVNHTDEELVVVLVLGTGEMPPSQLSPGGVADTLAWLRATFGAYNGEGH